MCDASYAQVSQRNQNDGYSWLIDRLASCYHNNRNNRNNRRHGSDPTSYASGKTASSRRKSIKPGLSSPIAQLVIRCRRVIWKGAVVFFGWVFVLISLGGQAPHVLTAHTADMGHTCGEPNEIELTAAHGLHHLLLLLLPLLCRDFRTLTLTFTEHDDG